MAMDNKNKGGQQDPMQTEDPNMQKKPQGTDQGSNPQQSGNQGNMGGNQTGNQPGQGDQSRRQDEKKPA
jgi:hypothetical protein